MPKLIGVAGVAACLLALAAPRVADAARLVRVGSFSSPTFVTAVRGAGPKGFFVVQRGGTVVRVHRGSRSTFARLTGRVSCCTGERGLLSMAFDPNWEANRRVYFFYTENDGDLVVTRFRANAAGTRIVKSTSRRMLHARHRSFANHNGGQLAFGPDGRLYVGMGDGGGGCDPFEAAQDLSSKLGKILRINPSTGAVSVFMYGVRNPWRFSFDRTTGNFWLGDVGQSTQEEVDFRKRSQLDPPDPWNGGWDVYEGRVRSTRSGCDGAGLNSSGTRVRPLAVYGHRGAKCSITGGYVYRGDELGIRGWYVYGDFCTGKIWRLQRRPDGSVKRRRMMNTALNISSLGEDKHGELFVADLNGSVYRFAGS